MRLIHSIFQYYERNNSMEEAYTDTFKTYLSYVSLFSIQIIAKDVHLSLQTIVKKRQLCFVKQIFYYIYIYKIN